MVFMALAAVLLCSCSLLKQEIRMDAMDTFMSFEYYGDEAVGGRLKKSVRELDSLLSVTKRKSEIFSLNKSGSKRVSADTLDLTGQAKALCVELSGFLDVTILPVVECWGFIDQRYKVPSKKEIRSALKSVDFNNIELSGSRITLKNGSRLDLGAVAKGYAADKGVGLLKDSGVKSAILNYGGTVAAVGSKPDGTLWKIGIADPDNPSGYVGFVSCKDKIVATSGGYERYFEKNSRRYIHILDPKTGFPVDNEISSVSVVSDSGVRSDALSTALFVMGREKALEYQLKKSDFGLIVLTKDKKVCVSPDLRDSFTLTSGDYTLTGEQ